MMLEDELDVDFADTFCSARKCFSFCSVSDTGNKWYEHQPEGVVETSDVKIPWDFNIQTDNEIQARRPDIVVVNKKDRKCYIIDVAVLGDVRIAEKETEKIEKYDELKREVERLWKVKAKVIPIVLGALGTVTRSLSIQ